MLIETPFGFSPAIFLACRSHHLNLWIVVCIWCYPSVRSLLPMVAIDGIYPTKEQKMRFLQK